MTQSTIQKWQMVIGLEIHAHINSKTKIFSRSKNGENDPNLNTSALDLAIPGSLPIINKDCIEKSIKAGLALNCKINNYSAFDRKNYFYPDSPLGYQISQFYHPIAQNGYITLNSLNDKKIRINRLHIEADAGKSIHNHNETLIDFNRAGTGLMEIVTEPDIRSAKEATETMAAIIKILQYSETSIAAMSKGTIRCDVNISVHQPDSKSPELAKLGTRVEVKNLNTLSNISDAIEYESKRQVKVLESGGVIDQETRLWDLSKNKTTIMRSKEDATDYRYFPDPNLNPIYVSNAEIEKIKQNIPVLHHLREKKYIEKYNIAEDNAIFLCSKKEISIYFDKVIQKCTNVEPKKISNWIVTVLFGLLNKENMEITDSKLTSDKLSEIINYVESSEISSSSGKKILTQIHKTGENIKELIDKLNLWQISDRNLITEWVKTVLNEQNQAVEKFLAGKENVKKSLVGMVLKKSKGKANPVIVNEIIDLELNKLR